MYLYYNSCVKPPPPPLFFPATFINSTVAQRGRKIGRNQWLLPPRPYFHFTVVCYDAGCDLVRFGRHLRSPLQVILHCTCSLPIKVKRLLPRLASCGLQRARERKRKREKGGKKSLWGFVLGCSGAEGTAAASAQQREWVSEKPRLSADLSFVAFPSFYTTHFAALAPSSVIHKHFW